MFVLFNRVLLAGAALAMVSAFVVVMLGVLGRPLGWSLPGLDAYAGYAIAAALFLALPETLRRDRHIRVLLVAQRLPAAGRRGLEALCVVLGGGLSAALAWYALRLVWLSQRMHDVSTAADATPLWLPQLAMAAGCLGLTAAFVHAGWCRVRGRRWPVAADAELVPAASQEV
jgi:TRAP-type C4-dicarboxylate transport system permease small subunit